MQVEMPLAGAAVVTCPGWPVSMLYALQCFGRHQQFARFTSVLRSHFGASLTEGLVERHFAALKDQFITHIQRFCNALRS